MTTTTYKTYTPDEIHAFINTYSKECFEIVNELFKQEVSRSRKIIDKGINSLKSGNVDVKALSEELYDTKGSINPEIAIGNFA